MTDESKDRLHVDQANKMNSRLYKIFDRYLDAVDDDNTLFDPRTLTMIQKFVKDNGATPVEQDMEALENKRREVARKRVDQERKRTTNKGVTFFDELAERRKKAQGE